MPSLCLFTDTLGDVNGVSRFILNMAAVAEASGHNLQVITSTRLPVPGRSNIRNLEPVVAGPMPAYPQLELVLPPAGQLLQLLKNLRPDAVHVSTPGPVGLTAIIGARRLGIPLLGVYHTDFPAYIQHLFDDAALTWLSGRTMQVAYNRFERIFTRSRDYANRLVEMGIPRQRIVRLQPGIDTSRFGPNYADQSIWTRLGLDHDAARAPKVLYIGRISVEKNLPLLTRIWKLRRKRWNSGPPPQLIIVGDGPYRNQMQRELLDGHEPPDVHFPGFRYGDELATIYASSDLFIFPSTTDTLGQVVMEAQCSGLPVLVSDQGGPAEVVTDGATGRILPVNSRQEPAALWVDAILQLLDDPHRRATMGHAARQAMQPLTIERSFEHFWSVHMQVVEQHSRQKAEDPRIRPKVVGEE